MTSHKNSYSITDMLAMEAKLNEKETGSLLAALITVLQTNGVLSYKDISEMNLLQQSLLEEDEAYNLMKKQLLAMVEATKSGVSLN